MDRKTLWWIIGGLGGIILLIVILSILGKQSEEKYYTYSEVENKLIEAAKNYYANNVDYLPKEDKMTSTVTLNNLIEENYIKPLNKYLEYGDTCSAKVVVSKKNLIYDYLPYLDCGSRYTSIELYKKVLGTNKIVTKGYGLYNIDGEKVFRGEVKNNYVMLNERLWRILRIDENNNLVLMSEFETYLRKWDDRYNINVDSYSGINNFEMSRIKEGLVNKYYNGVIFTSLEKNKIVFSKACIGSRGYNDSRNMKQVECSELSEQELPLRLLTVWEYLISSIDPNCKTIKDKGCTNYNFINDYAQLSWSITKVPSTSTKVYLISTNGISEAVTNKEHQVRYVVLLGPKAFYSSGNGTRKYPYIIK